MFQDLLGRQGLSLERLRTLIEVRDARSIVNAAGRDSVRQSQYSRQIKELGAFFGCELLEPRGRGRALTPAGERLARIAHDALRSLSDFRNEARDEPVSFALGTGDSLLHWWVIPRLARCRAKLGGASVELVSLAASDIVERLGNARLDYGLVRESEVPRDLARLQVGPLRFALYVPRALRTKGTKRATDDEILRSVPLALQQSEPQLNAALLKYAKEREIDLDVALRCETFPQAWRAVQSGAYASLLPVVARSELRMHEVDEVLPAGLKNTATKIVLAWQRRMPEVRPRVGALAETLAAALRGA